MYKSNYTSAHLVGAVWLQLEREALVLLVQVALLVVLSVQATLVLRMLQFLQDVLFQHGHINAA
jgi:hypothetical protein